MIFYGYWTDLINYIFKFKHIQYCRYEFFGICVHPSYLLTYNSSCWFWKWLVKSRFKYLRLFIINLLNFRYFSNYDRTTLIHILGAFDAKKYTNPKCKGAFKYYAMLLGGGGRGSHRKDHIGSQGGGGSSWRANKGSHNF